MKELPTPTLNLSPISLPRGLLHQAVQGQVKDRETLETGERSGLQIGWARHLDEVRQCQKLRYKIFADEMGAQLKSRLEGHDIDLFDDFCEHLLVRDTQSGQVIGTYRVLTPAQAKRLGGFYTETEFDLTRLRSLRERMVELGRSCVHPDFRHGGVIMALWGALAEFMVRNQLDVMVGCASIPMLYQGSVNADGAASIWLKLKDKHMAPIDLQVLPRLPLPVRLDKPWDHVEPPALIKGYLRLGAKIMGPPAWDPDFNTADLPMIMRISDMPVRYRKHFLGI